MLTLPRAGLRRTGPRRTGPRRTGGRPARTPHRFRAPRTVAALVAALAALPLAPAAAAPAAGASASRAPGTSEVAGPARAARGSTPPATAAAVLAAVRYRVPVDGPPRVARAFDPPPAPWLAGHRGIDLATTAGATVLAPAGGVVTFAGPVAGRGVVTVLHDDGRRSSLEPVRPDVAVGARVHAGGPLGAVHGDAHGRARDEPVLHWGVRDGDVYVDPWTLLPTRGPVVLLPVR